MLQLRLQTNSTSSERIEDLLFNCGAVSISFEDAADEPILEPPIGDHPIWSNLIIQAHFIEQDTFDLACKALEHEPAIHSQIELTQIDNQGWQEKFQQLFSAVQFGSLWIYPSWEDNPCPEGISLKLDPGLAFGTGHHPTTFLCLESLSQMPLKHQDVIDFGCGSGILALSAHLLGARHVYAVDIDPQAVDASIDNARRNNLSLEAFTIGTTETLDRVKAQVLVANILAAPLIQLRDKLKEHLHPEGILLLSGILNEQSDSIIKHYSKYFNCQQTRSKGDWAAITFTLKPTQ
jgi:ribosomal protein L11 methyltransferase